MKDIISKTYFQLPYVDAAHEQFYNDWLYELGRCDVCSIITLYLLGATVPTRTAFLDLVDYRDVYVVDDCWDAAWQTEDSRRVIALAVNLTTGGQYAHLDPAHLYDCAAPLALVMQSAIAYWHSHRDEVA